MRNCLSLSNDDIIARALKAAGLPGEPEKLIGSLLGLHGALMGVLADRYPFFTLFNFFIAGLNALGVLLQLLSIQNALDQPRVFTVL